jgi:cell division protein FtsI/penicillin-binding protein 2
MLDVTKAIEESADTFFYQVAYMMGIDRIHNMLSQFGYGKPTGIDLDEEYNGLLPSRSWKERVQKSLVSGRYDLGRHRSGLLDCHADSDGESDGGAAQ